MSTATERVEQLLHSAEDLPVRSQARAVSVPTPFEWLFVIMGGVPLFLPFLLLASEQQLSQTEGIQFYFWISALISAPHVYSTYVRQVRKTHEGKIHWALGIPGYAAAVLILLAASSCGYMVEAMTVVNIWQSFHYLRQTYGVGCLYGSQSVFDSHDRRMRWWAYHLAFPLLIIGRSDMLYEAWGGQRFDFIPIAFDDGFIKLLWCLAAYGAVLFAISEGRLFWKNGSKYRPTGIVCFIMFFAVHYYGFMVLSHYQRGFFTVTIFHALQYLALVWLMERKHAINHGARWMAAVPNVLGFVAFWLALFAFGYGYEQKFTMALTGVWAMAPTILLAAVSVHHYTVDSFLWRRHVGV